MCTEFQKCLASELIWGAAARGYGGVHASAYRTPKILHVLEDIRGRQGDRTGGGGLVAALRLIEVQMYFTSRWGYYGNYGAYGGGYFKTTAYAQFRMTFIQI